MAKKIEVQTNMILKSSKLEKWIEYFERIRVSTRSPEDGYGRTEIKYKESGDSEVKTQSTKDKLTQMYTMNGILH